MALKRGIIYGTRALFEWSSAYPNGRLIVVGLLMFAGLPVLMLFWLFSVAEIAIENYRPVPNGMDLLFLAIAVGFLIIVCVHWLGMWIMLSGIMRLVKAHSRSHAV